jgi:hypothetical protein
VVVVEVRRGTSTSNISRNFKTGHSDGPQLAGCTSRLGTWGIHEIKCHIWPDSRLEPWGDFECHCDIMVNSFHKDYRDLSAWGDLHKPPRKSQSAECLRTHQRRLKRSANNIVAPQATQGQVGTRVGKTWEYREVVFTNHQGHISRVLFSVNFAAPYQYISRSPQN